MNPWTDDPHPERTVLQAAVTAVLSGEAGVEMDRVALVGAANCIISYLLETVREDDQKLFPDYAYLNVHLTEFLDWIIRNAPEEDENLRILRSIAEHHSSWPTMVRPGDPKFSAKKVEKLRVGAKGPITCLSKDTKHPGSFATPSNEVTVRLVSHLKYLASRIVAFDDETAVTVILVFLPEMKNDRTRAADLLPILREINRLPAGVSPLSKENVKQWKAWLKAFVLIADLELTRYPELKNIKQGMAHKFVMKPKAILRSKLEKYFDRALRYLTK